MTARWLPARLGLEPSHQLLLFRRVVEVHQLVGVADQGSQELGGENTATHDPKHTFDFYFDKAVNEIADDGPDGKGP